MLGVYKRALKSFWLAVVPCILNLRRYPSSLTGMLPTDNVPKNKGPLSLELERVLQAYLRDRTG